MTLDDFELAAARGSIVILGAREHNLKNISLEIPRGQFVVVTGVSGSGKSTLAFDLIFAEGQRRFLDAMNTYARQFVEQLARPEVDLIAGLPPTVSIEQRNSRGGGKSTVATVTEIHHFIRLLFARLGLQHCPECGIPVSAQTRDQIAAHLLEESKTRGRLKLLAPVVRGRKGFHTDVAQRAARQGHAELRADGKMYSAAEPFRLDRFKEHFIEVVVGEVGGRGKSGGEDPGRMRLLVEETLGLGGGSLVALDSKGRETLHSTTRACPKCARSFGELDPKLFSYNSSQGWCPECRGFGELFYLPDVDRGARADAIEESWWSWQEGKREPCPSCHGARLNPVARAVRLPALRIPAAGRGKTEAASMEDLATASVDDALAWFSEARLEGRDAEIARDILPEIHERLKFLREVGLHYLQLGRGVVTLSGGEAQRIRLAAQLGSNLSGVLYVLDEPTIGLHARDNEHLLRALSLLRERGNSLLVVEHDEATMRQADYVVDLGPGAGVGGGTVCAAGTLAELMANPNSVTGRSLREEVQRPARGSRRPVVPRGRGATPHLSLAKASVNNLKNVTARFPLNRFVVVTGVSGSGKSTLIRECLLPAAQRALAGKKRGKKEEASPTGKLQGHEPLKAVYEVDQTPVGRTPRSTPATYVGFFDAIRELFAQVPEARLRGYKAGRFSFNSAQGRCPQCEGAGRVKLEMNFLPPAYVVCETCQGGRFNIETLDILYKGRNIAGVLDLSVREAVEFFGAVRKVRDPLQALIDTGLDYLKLGQISPTLSGGEAQRMKLVTHLLSGLKENLDLPDPGRKGNLFILEEPTIGLHILDVRRLVEVIQRLVDAGHSVLVIEHNLDLIAEADWVVDMGPEGGGGGGRVVAEGTPEALARDPKTHTGRYLAKILG